MIAFCPALPEVGEEAIPPTMKDTTLAKQLHIHVPVIMCWKLVTKTVYAKLTAVSVVAPPSVAVGTHYVCSLWAGTKIK